MVSNATKLTVAFVLGIAAYTSVVFISELLGHPVMSVTNSITGLLTLTVAVFAIVQGMAAYLQYEMQKNTNLIEDARNELEKAYGLIYTILSKTNQKDTNVIKINGHEKQQLDKIMSRYPFMFSQNIRQYWENNIRTLESKTDVAIPMESLFGGSGHLSYKFSEIYEIPVEFVTIFND